MKNPKARAKELLIQDVAGEVVVYDLKAHFVHRLNPTAAAIWKRCTGRADVERIAELVSSDLDRTVPMAAVKAGVDQLHRAGLLTEAAPAKAGTSRRGMLRKLAVGAAAAVPLVISMAAPTPAAAQSRAIACSFPAPTCPPGFSCCSPTGGLTDCFCVAGAGCNGAPLLFCGD